MVDFTDSSATVKGQRWLDLRRYFYFGPIHKKVYKIAVFNFSLKLRIVISHIVYIPKEK